jgi:hypothetical protein
MLAVSSKAARLPRVLKATNNQVALYIMGARSKNLKPCAAHVP